VVRFFAASAVTQNPPQFTEAAILALTDDRALADASVEGLKNLASPATRAKLLQMSTTTIPEDLRQAAIQALGEIGNPDDCQAILDLAGQSNNDNQIEAYMAAGRICKEHAITALYSLIPTANPELLKGLVFGFGNTSSRSAIPPLISLLQSPDPVMRRDVIGVLATLTHRSSQYGIEDESAAKQSYIEWLNWWTAYGKTVPIYDSDQCAAPQPLY
jgi:HEAT repeat protein